MYSAKAWSRPFLLILLCFATLIAEPAVNQNCIASALPDTGPPRRLHVLIYELKGICHKGLAEGEMHFLSREASRLHLLPIAGLPFRRFQSADQSRAQRMGPGEFEPAAQLRRTGKCITLICVLQKQAVRSRVQHPCSGMVFSAEIPLNISALRHLAQPQHHAQPTRKAAL